MRASRPAFLLAVLVGLLALSQLSRPSRVERTSVDATVSVEDPVERTDRLAELDAARGRVSEGTEGEPTVDPDANRATLDIVVKLRGTGSTIPHAGVWIFDDEMRTMFADGEGRATLHVIPGSVLVGADAPEGNVTRGLLVLAYDHETGEPSAETTVEVAAGERVEVELFLHQGATITGHVLRPDGEPAAGFTFARMHAVGDGWSSPAPIKTDENGRFVMSALLEDWYLLGPDPKGDDVFDYEKIHVLLGERKDVTLALKPGRLAQVTVDVVQETSGEPYPFPVTVQFVRADGLADVSWDSEHPGRWIDKIGSSPFELEVSLRPALYRVRVEGVRYMHGRAQGIHAVIAPHLKRDVHIEVGDDVADPVVRVEVPDVGPVAELQCLLTRPWRDSRTRLGVRYRDREGTSRYIPLMAPVDGHLFRVVVDLAEVPLREFEFVERRGGEIKTLQTIALTEGSQRVSLTPSKD